MAQDDSQTDYLEEEINAAIEWLRSQTSHQQEAEARVDALLAKQLSYHLQRLASVIGGSANRVTEAIGEFDDSATSGAEKLTHALDNFRDSMDKSSDIMARLTFWLVTFTAVLAVFTAILAVKDLDMHGVWEAVQSWLR